MSDCPTHGSEYLAESLPRGRGGGRVLVCTACIREHGHDRIFDQLWDSWTKYRFPPRDA